MESRILNLFAFLSFWVYEVANCEIQCNRISGIAKPNMVNWLHKLFERSDDLSKTPISKSQNPVLDNDPSLTGLSKSRLVSYKTGNEFVSSFYKVI